jgi:hypothetical protein
VEAVGAEGETTTTAGAGEEVAMSATASAVFAHLEEARQGAGVGFVGSELDGVDVGSPQGAHEGVEGLGLALGEPLASARIGRINLEEFARLGVLEDQPPQSGELEFEAVDDLHGDEIMAAGDLTQAGSDGLADEIR